MNKIIRHFNLKPADRIIIPKSGIKLVQHHAIYIGPNHQGIDMIAENKAGIGVQIITANEFFKGVTEITDIIRFKGDYFQRQSAIQRALRLKGKSYHLVNFNCESYANYVQPNHSTSSQATNGLGIFTAACLLFLVSKL